MASESLLVIENRHSTAPQPPLPTDSYGGYLANMHGEQALFHQQPGNPEGTLIHGDIEFQPVRVVQGHADLIPARREDVARRLLIRVRPSSWTGRPGNGRSRLADVLYNTLQWDGHLPKAFGEKLAEASRRRETVVRRRASTSSSPSR
jgi:hypothetical protein